MSAPARGAAFEQRRTLAAAHPGNQRLGGVRDRQHIVAIGLAVGDAEGLAPFAKIEGDLAIGGRKLAPAVGLADEQDRQLHQRRHIGALVQQALGQRAVAEERDGDVTGLLELVRECAAGRDRQPRANNAVRPQHADAHVGDMHRSAAAPANPRIARQQFGEKAIERHALGQCMAVPSVGRGDGVPRPQSAHHPDRNSLLADAEVNEARHFAFGEQPLQPLFAAADAAELLVET